MQSLDVISVNFWQIIISLANLTILFLILKKLLFKPVKNVLEARQKTLDSKYEEADKSAAEAEENKKAWEEKLRNAEEEADAIIRTASEDAKNHSDRIVADARNMADGIVRQAKNAAELLAQEDVDGGLIGGASLKAEDFSVIVKAASI